MKVEILARRLITPSSPTPPHLRTLSISSFDQLVAPIYTTFTLFYPAFGTTMEERNARNAERSKQLQKSLSESLTIYYPLAGRHVDGDASFDCNDKGAEYLEARAICSLSQLIEEEEVEAELSKQIIPYVLPPSNEAAPMLAVQFTKFECGGIAIGISVLHRFADAFTAVKFAEFWAATTRLGLHHVRFRPSFGISSTCPPRDTSSFKLVPPSDIESKKIVRKRFVFNDLAISKLKALAKFSDAGEEIPKHQPTRVEAVTALLWKACIEAAQARRGCSRPSVIVVPLNMRGKTTFTPVNSRGNLVRFTISQEFKMNEAEINQKQLGELAGKVHEAISRGLEECRKATNTEELFLKAFNAMKEFNEIIRKSNVDVFLHNTACGFPVYESDFGWGKPIWLNPILPQVECMFIMDAKDGKGIEAWMSMEENSMLLFQQNPDIIAFTGRKRQPKL